MHVLSANQGKTFACIQIGSPDDFECPFQDALYPCLIWDHTGMFTEQQRATVAKALLDSGCRYAVCGGVLSGEWENAVDLEFVRRHLDEAPEILERLHVMTTSHVGETPDEVAFFFVLSTNFDDHDFRHYLVVHVGAREETEEIDAAVRRYASGSAD